MAEATAVFYSVQASASIALDVAQDTLTYPFWDCGFHQHRRSESLPMITCVSVCFWKNCTLGKDFDNRHSVANIFSLGTMPAQRSIKAYLKRVTVSTESVFLNFLNPSGYIIYPYSSYVLHAPKPKYKFINGMIKGICYKGDHGKNTVKNRI